MCGKLNNKYFENCNQNNDSSYLTYLDKNNLHEWAIL